MLVQTGGKDGVPNFLLSALEYIQFNGIMLKGIFRISGDAKEVMLSKQKLDYGGGNTHTQKIISFWFLWFCFCFFYSCSCLSSSWGRFFQF